MSVRLKDNLSLKAKRNLDRIRHRSSHDHHAKQPSPVQKRLDFSEDSDTHSDHDILGDITPLRNINAVARKLVCTPPKTIKLMGDPNYVSPRRRTRSGKVYHDSSAHSSAEKRFPPGDSSAEKRSKRRRAKRPRRRNSSNASSNIENEVQGCATPPLATPLIDAPPRASIPIFAMDISPQKPPLAAPPLCGYQKRHISRFSDEYKQLQLKECPQSPLSHGVRSLSIASPTSPVTSRLTSHPVSLPRVLPSTKQRLAFDVDEDRGRSVPLEKKIEANVNPFTPTAILNTMRKRGRMNESLGEGRHNNSLSPNSNGSFTAQPIPIIRVTDDDDDLEGGNPAKRVRVSNFNISRYEKEFVEINEIATGEFGKVMAVRHRLDGMVYAIKITKNPIRPHTHDESAAMNEIFAHSALVRHKHVVRYFNSWVEDGKVFIQNEYCEGGSLAQEIEKKVKEGKRFSERELKKIILHVAKGLQHIHSLKLVHLDIKPENILISDNPMNSGRFSLPDFDSDPLCESTDSGMGSDKKKRLKALASGGNEYKIGDLGKVVQIFGDVIPDEGDCRYMAPELLEWNVNHELLPRADIFSLGLSVYEAATLKPLPKNSMDSEEFGKLQKGEIPYLTDYSPEFNALLRTLVSPDPLTRPSASRLLQQYKMFLNPWTSHSQLCRELKKTRQRAEDLEKELLSSFREETRSEDGSPLSEEAPFAKEDKSTVKRALPPAKRRLIGKGTVRSNSCFNL